MDDWKELDIANLPPDILVGDYEIQFNSANGWVENQWYKSEKGRTAVLDGLENKEKYQYRYRKRAPKAPTHEEAADDFMCGIGASEIYDKTIEEICRMAFIEGRKSADIPLES